eukprot:gene12236-5822_t
MFASTEAGDFFMPNLASQPDDDDIFFESISEPIFIQNDNEELDKDEIEKKYYNVLLDSGIRHDLAESLSGLGIRAKNEIIKQYEVSKQVRDLDNKKSQDILDLFLKSDLNEIENDLLQEIRLILSTRHSSLVEHFVLHDGISKLLSLLYTTNLLSGDKIKLDIKKQYETLLSLKAIISAEEGMKTFLMDKHGINTVAELLNSNCMQSREISCSILSLISLYSVEGFKLVIHSIDHFKLVTREKKRFMFLIDSLEETKDNFDYIASVLMLINSLLYSSSDDATRNLLQKEVIDLGLLKLIKELKSDESAMYNEKLKIQISAFEDDISDSYQLKYTELDDPEKIAKLLHVKLSGTESSSHFINILRYLYIAAEDKNEKDLNENFNLLEMMIKKSLTNEKGLVKEVSLNEIKLNDRINFQQNQIDSFEKTIKEKNSKMKENVSKWLSFKIDSNINESVDLDDSMYKEIYSSIISTRKQYEDKLTSKEHEILNLQKKINQLKGKLNEDSLKTSTDSNISDVDLKTPTSISIDSKKSLNGKEFEEPIIEEVKPTGGPIPPPPPSGGPNGGPPSMSNLDLPTMEISKPKVSVKAFHCVDLPKSKVKKSIFMKNIIEDYSMESFGIDFKTIEEKYTTKSKEMKKKKEIEKPKVVNLLTPSRSYNVSIILKTIKLSPKKIYDAILEMEEGDDEDVDILSEENIDSLIKICPTPEEIEMISTYSGDLSLLPDAEQFFLKIKEIPNIHQRLECWKFKKSFKDILANLKPDIQIIMEGIKELKESSSFMKILGIVLTIANFMSKSKKPIYGFKMSSLMKLKDTKSSNNKSNLLQFLVKHIMKKENEEIKNFENELENVCKSSRISFDSLTKQILNLKSGIKEVLNQIKSYEELELKNENDEFLTRMKDFEINATFEISEISEKYEKMKEELNEISVLYDEPECIIKPEEFFNQISSFIDCYKREKKEYLDYKKNAGKKSFSNSSFKKKSQIHSGNEVQNQAHSVLDIIRKNMTNGNIFKQKKIEREEMENKKNEEK